MSSRSNAIELAKKATVTSSSPVLCPIPQRTPRANDFQLLPTDNIASAERWSGPARTCAVPMESPRPASARTLESRSAPAFPGSLSFSRNVFFLVRSVNSSALPIFERSSSTRTSSTASIFSRTSFSNLSVVFHSGLFLSFIISSTNSSSSALIASPANDSVPSTASRTVASNACSDAFISSVAVLSSASSFLSSSSSTSLKVASVSLASLSVSRISTSL
mmetsp:Transcript_7855/g.13559  ORF Transcript_7855/g.13559 Transcript_7855/m.13559 type:complete len:220 (+) Transcript_7855:583-1242(+)